MRKLALLTFGVAIGFVAAHFVNQTPSGRRFFTQVNRGVQEFNDAMASGYRTAEEEFSDVLHDVERRLSELEAKS